MVIFFLHFPNKTMVSNFLAIKQNNDEGYFSTVNHLGQLKKKERPHPSAELLK